MDYNLWQQLILGATKPFRTGANILAQNWGSALTGKDMSQGENQGKFLKWLAGGLTPEEQEEITNKPYLSALKSGAGMASTLAPFASQGLRTAQLAANPLANRIAQLASQGALEGSLGGFGYSREGREVQDTLTGAALGAGGELLMDYLTNPQFRKMITDASTYVDPTTGTRMYRGGLGNNDDIIINRWDDPKPIAKADGEIPMSSYEDYLDPDNPVINLDGSTVDNRRVKYTGPEIVDSADIDKMVDPNNPVIDLLKEDPVAKLEVEAKNYATPEEFVKAQGAPVYHGTNEVFDNFDLTKSRFKGEQGENLWGFGTYTSPDIRTAKNYGKNILEIPFSPKKPLNLSNFKTTKELADYLDMSEDALIVRNGIPTAKGQQAAQLSSKAQELGHDAIIAGQETVILDPSQIKTKSQLIDIWKRAHPNELGNSIRGGFREIIEKMGRDGLK